MPRPDSLGPLLSSWGPQDTPAFVPRAPSARPPHRSRLAPIVFPVALFLISALFLQGDLGLWNDDYQWAQRDVVTDQITGWRTDQGGQFWRPLHFLLTTALFTALHHHLAAVHLITALAHAGAALLLHRLLLNLGRSPHAAAAGALLFLTYPAHFQVVFWPSALSTGLSTSIVLGIFLLTLRSARAGTRGFMLLLPLFPLLTFAAACFNEQPVGALLALPFLSLAATPAGTSAPRALLRAVLPPLTALPAAAAYIALYITTTVPGYAGTPAALPDGARLIESLPSYFRAIRRELRLHEFAPGAFSEGVRTLAAHPALTAAAVTLLAVGLVLFLHWWFTEPTDGEPGFAPRLVATVRVRVLTAAAGAAAFCGAWVPVIGTGYPVDSRLCYAPAAALAVLLTLAADSALAPLHRRRPLATLPRAAAAVAVIPAMLMGAVCLIGVQAAMRQRSELDRSEGAQLRALVPDPQPGTLFVPLRIAHRPLTTGSDEFDTHFNSAWSVPWASRWHIKRVYQRWDVHCNFYYPWLGLPRLTGVYRAAPGGLTIHEPMGGPFAPDAELECGFVAPWSAVIPFEIDERGAVRIITRLTADQPEGPSLEVDVPQAAHLPPNSFHLAHPPAATPVP